MNTWHLKLYKKLLANAGQRADIQHNITSFFIFHTVFQMEIVQNTQFTLFSDT